MNNMSLEHKTSIVADLMEVTLARFITVAVNDCVFQGTTKEFIGNLVHPLFLKANAEASKENNPNWNQEMNGPFANKYRKAVCNELETLEGIRAWGVVDPEDHMNVIIPKTVFYVKSTPEWNYQKVQS